MSMRTAACCVLLGVAPVALGDTIEIGAIKDNTLFESSTGSLSNGKGPYMFAGRTNQNRIRRALAAFDVAAAVPAGATITGVELSLYCSASVSGDMAASLHRVVADWGEGTSNSGDPGGQGAASTTGDATWIHRFYNTATWAAPGGDFTSAASASTLVASTGTYTWSGGGMVGDVQAWLDNPGAAFGWLVRVNESVSGSAKRFNTRESGAPEDQPRLRIDYVPIPAPPAAGLLVMGGLVAGRRRR